MKAKTYFGKVCSKHPELNGERYSSARACTACSTEKAKQRFAAGKMDYARSVYVETHKAEIAAYSSNWYTNNKERKQRTQSLWNANNKASLKESQRKYCDKNKSERAERSKQWRSVNKATVTYYAATRRATKKLRTPKWADNQVIKDFYANCPAGYHVDHVVPLRGETVSGLHVIENLQYLPAAENLRKSNKFGVTG